jgi:hypothetical protein
MIFLPLRGPFRDSFRLRSYPLRHLALGHGRRCVMKTLIYSSAAWCALVGLTTGCRMFSQTELAKGHSPLRPAQASPDSVAMQLIWARYPAQDHSIDDAWREIDETQIEPSVRRELADNGLRAGVIGATMIPDAIERVMHRGESRPRGEKAPASNDPSSLAAEPVVHGRVQQLRRNQRSEIQASEVYPTLPLLVRGGSELGGHTYSDAQAIYALRVDPQPDRTTLVELTPELHFGQPHLNYTGEEGVLRQVLTRDREVFERLRISVKLAPGEMLVLMSLPDAGRSLGHYFHTVDSADGCRQKLILIRVAEVPNSDTFAAVSSL